MSSTVAMLSCLLILIFSERSILDTACLLIPSRSPKFSQQLKYQDGTNPQWNGNISQQLWGDDATLPNTYSYSYDKLNRLLSGVSTPAGVASMSEVITYDELGMGNIKTLKRDALAVTTYAYNGNKLTGLTGGLTGAYTYDGNGNATKDRTGMIFGYNYLNLPQSATKTGTSVAYLYDAMGTKLRKTATVNGTATVQDYVSGIEYNGANIDIIHNPQGYALRSGTSYVYHYNLTDHLGNVRATLKRGSTATAVDVTQRDNYYPFGKQKVVAGGNNKYLYNGKEIQGELEGQYDYGARFYDAEIGRWNVIDPMAEMFDDVSPYNYGMNNPILMVDPTGMAADTTGGRNVQPITPTQASSVIPAGVAAVNVLKEVIVTGSRYVGNALTYLGSVSAIGTLGTAVTGTVGLVLLPLDAGRGSEMNRPFVIPPYLLPKEDNDKSFIDKYTPAPKELKGFPDSKRVPNKGRARWKNKDGRILEWDSQHGDVEVYNKQGKHQGSADPNTGEMIKPPVPGRTTRD